MAIAFGRVAHNGWGSNAGGNVVVAVTINNGETAVVEISQYYSAAAGQGGMSVSSISGGGTYTQQGSTVDNTDGTAHRTTQIWSTSAGGATSASTCSVAMTGDAACVEVVVRCYTGVDAIGTTASNTGTSTNPTVSLTTQDNNNWVVAAFNSANDGPATALTGNLRDTGLQTGAQDVGTSSTDNTSVSVASVTNAVTLASSTWAALALELRAAQPTAAVTGTITSSATEADIVAGGKTIIITLTNDTWVPA